MKIRTDFVTNSSSSSFIVVANVSDKELTMLDFMVENLDKLLEYVPENYVIDKKINLNEEAIKFYKKHDKIIAPKEIYSFWLKNGMDGLKLERLFLEVDENYIELHSKSFAYGIYYMGLH